MLRMKEKCRVLEYAQISDRACGRAYAHARGDVRVWAGGGPAVSEGQRTLPGFRQSQNFAEQLSSKKVEIAS